MEFSGLEYPKGSGNHLLKGLSMWFGGVNELGETRISAPTDKVYEDQFSGPLTINSGDASYGGWDSKIYSISREEIDYHVTNYQNPNYVPLESIYQWPAHGDVSEGFDFYLAPFVDLNGDGYYSPHEGEYPCIQGDEAVYMILNDRRGSQGCGSPWNDDALRIEIHYLFYQYSSIRDLANTTFCKARVINRSGSDYTDFNASVFMNPEIGSAGDDFVGTDVDRNMMFAYNGEEVDGSYGYQAPAVGVVSLNNSLSRTRVFGQGQKYVYDFPSSPSDFWQVMDENLRIGQTRTKQFGFPGDPVLSQGDVQIVSEHANSMIYTIDIGDFKNGEERIFDFAIVVGQGVNHLESVQQLREEVDLVQNHYNKEMEMCYQGVRGTPAIIDLPAEPSIKATLIYPNPSNGEFTVEVEERWIGAELNVFNMHGTVQQKSLIVTDFQNNVTIANAPGVYFVTLKKDDVSKIFKAVVE